MRFHHCEPFPPTLWAETGPGRRSSDLTPLYAERFQGPRSRRSLWRHDYWEMLHVMHGTGDMLGDPPVRFALAPGMTVLIPPDYPHLEVSSIPIDIIWVGLGGSRVEQLTADGFRTATDSEAGPFFEVLWQQSRRGSGLLGPELDGLALTLLGRLLRRGAEGSSPATSRVERAIRLFSEQYAADISMPEVAADLGWSEGHFYRAFRAHTGRTPVAFLRDVRIRQAVNWLGNSDLSVSRIARLAGFRDPRYFSRVFRTVTGHAPRRTRGPLPRPGRRDDASPLTGYRD